MKNKLVEKLMKSYPILDYHNIADLLLVWSGFKKSAMVEISYFRRPGLSRQIFLKRVKDLEKIMEQLSLKFELHINYPKSKKEISYYSYIARDQKTLKKLIDATNETDDKKRRLAVGKLLGYPKTAVSAFATGKVIEIGELPTEVLRLEELKFLRFRLSKSWKNELRYVGRLRDEIKNIAPALYQKIKK